MLTKRGMDTAKVLSVAPIPPGKKPPQISSGKLLPAAQNPPSKPTNASSASRKGAAPLSGKRAVILGTGSKAVYKAVAPTACDCYGTPKICSICMSR